MIHRQETMNLLGFPMAVHRPAHAGRPRSRRQIASALRRHPGTVRVFVPRYAMSGRDAHRPGRRRDRHGSERGARAEAGAERLATKLSSGEWTHDHPLQVEELRQLGFTVREVMPREVYDLVELYPQSNQRRPGVEFIPLPYSRRTPVAPTKTDRR